MEETKKEFTPRPERAERPQRGRRRRKVCAFCVDKVAHVDYKDAGKLKKYMSERGKILPRRMPVRENKSVGARYRIFKALQPKFK